MNDHDRYRREHMDAPREVKPIPVGPCELAGRLADALPIDPAAEAAMESALAHARSKQESTPIVHINPRQSHAFVVLAHEAATEAARTPEARHGLLMTKRRDRAIEKAIALARAADEAIGKESPDE